MQGSPGQRARRPSAYLALLAALCGAFLLLILLVGLGLPVTRLSPQSGPALVSLTEEGVAQALALAPVHGPLAPLSLAFAHNLSLPVAMLARGVISSGSNAAAAEALTPLLTGRALSVGVLGGSLTYGRGASRRGKTDWVSVLRTWLHTSFPGANHTVVNGAIPAAPSEWASFCMLDHLPPNPDIVLVEYVINDMAVPWEHAHRRSYERLLRRLLTLPTKPLVIPIMLFNYHPNQHNGIFHNTPENDIGTFSLFYNLPWLSMRSVVYFPIANGTLKKSVILQGDVIHPTDKGHKVIADLVIHYLRMAAAAAALRPPSLPSTVETPSPGERETLRSDTLPGPMLPDLVELPAEYCAQGEKFRTQVARNLTGGFAWKGSGDELRALTTANVAAIDLHVNASSTAPGANTTALLVFTAKSHGRMGNGGKLARCVSGCTCADKALNGTIPHLFGTQEHLDLLIVTPSPECVVRIETRGATDSKGHEFRVRGVVVSSAAAVTVPEEFNWGEELQFAPHKEPRLFT